MRTMRMYFLTGVFLGVGTCLNAVEVTVTWPRVTVGQGDQFPWTQLAGGDHLTVVNDGRGPYVDIGDACDRRAVTDGSRGSTYNHKVFRARGMNLDDLANPQWVTDEYGYGNAPREFDRLGAYCFGILAIGDQHVIVPLALQSRAKDVGNAQTSFSYY